MIVSPDKDVIVGVGGQVSAPLTDSQNYVIASGMSSISNYAQWGNDLIVQFSSGQELRINNFFTNGPAFHKLMVIDNGVRIEIDFTHALTSTGDGIDDSLIQYIRVGESPSVKTLLGILGGAVVGGAGIYSVFGKSDDNGEKKYTAPNGTVGLPDSPDADVVNDNKTPNEVVRNGASTNDNTPTLHGEDAIPGGRITIRVNGGDPIYVTVGQDGKWSYTFPELADGTYNVTITQTNLSGSTSEATNIQFTVDTVAPDVPHLNSVYDNVDPVGTIENGGITNDATPEFKGTAEAGSKVNIYIDGTVVGTTRVGSDGNWAIELTKNLSDGEHKAQISTTDAAGNESGKTSEFTFTVHTAPPSPINANSIYWGNADGGDLTAFSSNNPVNTTIRKVTLEGLANAVGQGYDAKWIEVFDNGLSLGRVEIGSDGKWRYASPNDLSLGSHNFSFEAIDAAGNRSSRTSVSQFIISAPSAANSSDSSDANSVLSDDTSGGISDDNLSSSRSSHTAPHSQNEIDSHQGPLNANSATASETVSSDQYNDVDNTQIEPLNTNFSYKVGNFIDGSDATIDPNSDRSRNEAIQLDHAIQHDSIETAASANEGVVASHSVPTTNLLGEIGINATDDANNSLGDTSDLNLSDLLGSNVSDTNHVNDVPALDSFVQIPTPTNFDQHPLSYI